MNEFKLFEPSLGGLPTVLISLGEPLPFLLLSTALVLVPLLQKKLRLAVVVAFIIGGSNVTTQILKKVLTDHRADGFYFGISSWPSGHTTVIVSLALCAVLVAPARRRPLVAAVAGMIALGTQLSLMIRGHHLPSDVLGGVLVSAAFAFFGVAALDVWDRSFAHSTGREMVLRWSQALLPSLTVLWLIIGVLVVLLLTNFHDVSRIIVDYPTFVVGSIGFFLLGLFLSTRPRPSCPLLGDL